MDPCIFPDKKNPITKDNCRESFKNFNKNYEECYSCFKIPEDPISQLYFASVGILGVYILYNIMLKNDMIPSR